MTTKKCEERVSVSLKDRALLFERCQGRCYLCGDEVSWKEDSWEADHVLPFSKAPEYDRLDNMMVAHRTCNRRKSNKSVTQLVREGWHRLDVQLIEHVCKSALTPAAAAKLRHACKLLPSSRHCRLSQIGEQSAPRVSNILVEQQEASGGQAEILRAAADREECVLKRPLRGTPVEHVFREAGALVRLQQHENIVRMLGLFFHGPEQWCLPTLVLERLDCTLDSEAGLRAARENGPFSSAAQLAKAVAFVHRNGLLHRDVRPANVMLSLAPSSCRLKLIDFGAAVEQSAHQQDRVCALGYRAPELGAGVHTCATDVYALARTLHETLVPGIEGTEFDPAKRPTADQLVEICLRGCGGGRRLCRVYYVNSKNLPTHVLHSIKDCHALLNATSSFIEAIDDGRRRLCKRCNS